MSYNAENLTDHASNVENQVEISTASYHLNHAVIHGAHQLIRIISLYNHIDYGVTYHDSSQDNICLTTHAYQKGKRPRLQNSQSAQ